MGRDGGGGMSDSVLRKVLLSYLYVAVWIFLSFSVIVYNKYILDPKMYNWPFPISLTMVHMAFCSSLAVALVRLLRVVDLPTSPAMTPQLYTSSVVPIGALYAMSLWFSNSAYIYLSVSFIQMLKALMPVAVYSIGVLFKKETFRSSSMLNMLSISFGVAIAAYGEARFDLRGVALQLAAVAFEATRLVLIQILLTSKGISLNPITSLYYVAPCCLCFLVVPWAFVELPRLRAVGTFQPDFFIFGTNSLCAFALNLAVFLLVGKTSALTMNVAGVVKDWLLIAFSWSVIRDTVTPINLFGYGIAFLGVAYYNHVKLQALKAKEAQKKATQADEEAGSLLQERDGHRIRCKVQRLEFGLRLLSRRDKACNIRVAASQSQIPRETQSRSATVIAMFLVQWLDVFHTNTRDPSSVTNASPSQVAPSQHKPLEAFVYAMAGRDPSATGRQPVRTIPGRRPRRGSPAAQPRKAETHQCSTAKDRLKTRGGKGIKLGATRIHPKSRGNQTPMAAAWTDSHPTAAHLRSQ
ncbi:hypothetical protein U9M48_044404 [Paspalum notatum var. saurae]|uniref:Sugar phosphate transporter domain-containing protein n=1 Tax=Paspalum notatum var. saurae TaxID=547442 RepID=A0AAQ3UZ85_PASNO